MSPNDTVKIKLTRTGKQLIVDSIDKTNDLFRAKGLVCRMSLPKWDSEGWLSGQFWVLMEYFDGYWSKTWGSELPFTEMQVESK